MTARNVFGAEIDCSVWKRRFYRTLGWLFRTYVACLGVVSLYSLLWLFEIAGLLDDEQLAAIWLAIVAMGVVFLALLIPVYYTSGGRRP